MQFLFLFGLCYVSALEVTFGTSRTESWSEQGQVCKNKLLGTMKYFIILTNPSNC